MKRDLTETEKEGGWLYGTCPNGHGDDDDRVAAEVGHGRESYPNCPLCGARLTDTTEVAR